MDDTARNLTPRPLPLGGCFITGTDTGVGKTIVTAALALALKRRNGPVGVMKPVETGCDQSDGQADSQRLRQAAGLSEPLELIAPYRFAAPLAPLAAAQEAHRTIDLAHICLAFKRLSARYRHVLVEGLGGVRVPLTDELDLGDLMQRLELRVVVVGRAALGGVNHAMLTLEALQRRGLTVLALMLNASAPAAEDLSQVVSTTLLLQQRAGVPVLGPLPHLPEVQAAWGSGIDELAGHPAIQRLADLVSTQP